MFRRCVVLAVFLLIVPLAGAQEPEGVPERITSLEQAIGLGNPPTRFTEKKGGGSRLKTSDGEAHWGRSAGVVIVRANTDKDGIALPCIDALEEVEFAGFDLLQATLQSLVFKPSPRRSSLLEIIWSGQVILNGAPPPDPGSFDQKAFFMCTVWQKGESVPCSGTAEVPVVAEEMTGDGLSEWVNYHGYVEFNPKGEVTVEIAILATTNTFATICGDTITLKY
jgi:hypothetical protein